MHRNVIGSRLMLTVRKNGAKIASNMNRIEKTVQYIHKFRVLYYTHIQTSAFF